jgi:hypothetical protein
MIDQAARTLTLHQAAQVICRTQKPSGEQIAKVQAELENGVLKGQKDPKYGWTTTGALVAEYMARRQLHKQRVKREAAEGKSVAGSAGASHADEQYRGGEELKPVYRDILKDYFLTVLMRRRMGHQSTAFKVSVLAGQFLLLFAMVGGMVWGVKATIIPQPPEQKAVEEYVLKNFPESRIQTWGPSTAVPGGTNVAVKFRYRPPGGKGVETERQFLVAGGRVAEVSQGSSSDD